jgi:radical SAM superfamily enzyme YgiQ (UPF0313 family)
VGTALHHAGYRVVIVDQRVKKDWKFRLTEALKEDVLFVGISSMTGGQISYALEIAEFLRAHTKRPIVWGGIHPTLLPQQTLEHKLVDIIVRGEGEETIVELTKALQDNEPLNGIQGVSFEEKGEIIHNPDRPFIDLNTQPHPHYEMVNMQDYIDHDGDRSANIGTSRGCPFNCAYCYVNAYHKRRWRALSAENVLKRMHLLVHKYGIHRFWFDDDEFFINLDRAKEIVKGIKKLGVRWSGNARIDMVLKMDAAFLELLEQSGCIRLGMGVESGSNRILELIKKNITREDAISVSRRLTNYNFYSKFNFMVGFPTESVEDMKETVSLALQIKKENKKALVSAFNIFTPYPGCELFDLAVNRGMERPTALEQWAKFRPTIDNIAWMSNEMKRDVRMLSFASPFLNDPVETSPPLHMKILGTIYRRIARKRIKHHYYHFPLEISFAKLLGLYDNL